MLDNYTVRTYAIYFSSVLNDLNTMKHSCLMTLYSLHL